MLRRICSEAWMHLLLVLVNYYHFMPTEAFISFLPYDFKEMLNEGLYFINYLCGIRGLKIFYSFKILFMAYINHSAVSVNGLNAY